MKVYTLTYDTETEFGTELHQSLATLWYSAMAWSEKVMGTESAREQRIRIIEDIPECDNPELEAAKVLLKAVEEEAEVWAIFRIQEFEL